MKTVRRLILLLVMVLCTTAFGAETVKITELSVKPGNEEATLKWGLSSNTNVIDILVEDHVNGVWNKLPLLPASSTSITIKHLPAEEVAFRVWAVLKQGNQSVTAKIGMTPPPPPIEEEKPVIPPPSGGLYLSPAGSDLAACTELLPCATMKHVYEIATSNTTVYLLSGSYPTQSIQGTKSISIIFKAAAGSIATVTGTIDIFASNVTIEGLNTQDVTIGNYDQTPGRPNPNNVVLRNLTGRNFQIDSASNVTVEGGSWGPASACGGPYGGSNNSIRQPETTPENILIRNTVIHDVQSYSLVGCHIEGLAIFAGNHVTVENTKFYGNSVYDIFVQANSGGSPNNLTIRGNWLADPVDNSGANGQTVGAHNGISFGSEISKNLTLEANHMVGIININDDGSIKNYEDVFMTANVGKMAYNNYPCQAELKGVIFTKNIWQNDKCSESDVNLNGAPFPFVNIKENSELNYTLTGIYTNWPE